MREVEKNGSEHSYCELSVGRVKDHHDYFGHTTQVSQFLSNSLIIII